MAKWFIGIDLGGTYIKFGLLDDQRRAGESFQLPTPAGAGAEGVIGQMVAGARQLMDRQKLSKADVAGVGIGSPGPLSISKGIVLAMPNITGMTNVPIRDEVSRRLGLPAVLENDANAAALGEYLCGAGGNGGDMVLLTLGTGIGSGIIIGGRILHGAHEIGAEMGHLIIVPGGEPCGCGQRGCLERYSSATYLAANGTKLLQGDNRPSSLRKVLAAKGQVNSQDINEARRAGDAVAGEIWDRAVYYLAIGCVSICRLFDPVEIVLAGGLAKAGEDLMQPLRRHFLALHWKLTEPMTEIVFSRLGEQAGVIGAAGVAWQAFAPARP